MLKQKLQYFGHLMQITDSLEKIWCWERLNAGEGDRGWDGWIASPIRWTGVWASSRSWWWTEKSGSLQSLGLQRVGHDWVTELNWTDLSGWLCILLTNGVSFIYFCCQVCNCESHICTFILSKPLVSKLISKWSVILYLLLEKFHWFYRQVVGLYSNNVTKALTLLCPLGLMTKSANGTKGFISY